MDFACKNVEGACQQASWLVIIAEPKPFLGKRVKGGFQQMPWEKASTAGELSSTAWYFLPTATIFARAVRRLNGMP